MKVIELIMLTFMIIYAIYTFISDIYLGIITNKSIIITILISATLDIYYYGFTYPINLLDFLNNLIIMTIFIAFFYLSHTLAAGDCKYLFVISLFYPSRMYFFVNNSCSTLWIIVILAFFIGFIYMASYSLFKLIKNNKKPNIKRIADSVFKFIISYIKILIYTSFINILFEIISDFCAIPIYIYILFDIMTVYTVIKIDFFKYKSVIFFFLIMDIVLSILFKAIPFSLNITNYTTLLIIMIIKNIASYSNYQVIDTSMIQEKMIISYGSSMLMQKSKIKGIPPVSTESLKSRLTKEQVEAVKKWGNKSKNNQKITIVRKIPFAAFISIGLFIYTALGVFVHDYSFQ